MSLLSDLDRQKVREALAGMQGPVTVLFFTQTLNSEGSEVTKQILGEITPLSDQLTVREVNLVLDTDEVARYGVDRAPTLVLLGPDDVDHGVRFVGAPAGYEFVSLIEAIVFVSGRVPELSPASMALIAAVNQPVHIQVFVTPT